MLLPLVVVVVLFISFVILLATLKLDGDSVDDFNGDNDE